MNTKNISMTEADSAQVTDHSLQVQFVWEVCYGNRRLNELQPALKELAAGCGQAQLVEHLEHFITNPYPGSRQSARVFRRLGFESEMFAQRSKRLAVALQWCGNQLAAAVILYEYRFFGVPTTLYVSADPDGWRTVIAAVDQRLDVATECSEHLIASGATLVFVSYITSTELRQKAHFVELRDASISVDRGSRFLLASQRRSLRRRLSLMPDYDSTLATLGTRTRRNFRAATRRVMNELGCEYHPNAQVSEEDFLEAYRRSTHPMPDWIASWRYASIQATPGAFLAGMRSSDGVWLGLIGGRRSGDTSFIDWQINAAYDGPLSFGTALRAFLVEDEHRNGITLLHFEGGTSHTMSHAFLDDGARDLLFARPNLPRRLLRLIARFFPPGGLLAQAILGSEIEWTQ